MVTKRLYGKEWEWSIGQIKTCRKKQHVEIDDIKEMSDLICGKAAVGGNYNSTRDSPGTLPGTVRLNNMREIHFSRNPKMAQLLHEYEYVREFGEGVDRMYREMEEAGLPEPEYKTVAFMVHATIKNKKYLVGENSVEQNIDNNSKASSKASK